MPDSTETVFSTVPARRGLLQRLFGTFRAAYVPILVTYFAWGASGITAVAALYFQKDALKLTPAEAAGIGFWLGLPWSMKMIVGVASDAFPILGSRRKAYLILGALCSVVGYALVAWSVSTRDGYLAAMLLVVIGFMGRSPDAYEGVTSFLEKRPANFPDKVSDGLPDVFPWLEKPEFS